MAEAPAGLASRRKAPPTSQKRSAFGGQPSAGSHYADWWNAPPSHARRSENRRDLFVADNLLHFLRGLGIGRFVRKFTINTARFCGGTNACGPVAIELEFYPPASFHRFRFLP